MCNCYICRFFFLIISKLYIDMCIELFFLKFEICILIYVICIYVFGYYFGN